MYHVLILILNYVAPQHSTQQDFLKGSNQGQANVYSGANCAIPGPVGISTLYSRDSLASEFQVIPSVRQY